MRVADQPQLFSQSRQADTGKSSITFSTHLQDSFKGDIDVGIGIGIDLDIDRLL